MADVLARRGTTSFGTAEGADWRLTEVVAAPDATTCAAETPVGRIAFRIGAPGAHFATNALAVLAACHALGADVARAALSLSTWLPPEGRGRRYAVRLAPGAPPVDLIDDAYNANPASVGAALDLLAASAPPRGGRRIAILGDMKELGEAGPDLHAALADHPAMDRIDRVHTVGPLMRALHEALPADRRGRHVRAASGLDLRGDLRPGDTVLVKGSLSMKMADLVETLRRSGE
jgi:UDP-N-acetylmuramoyl-tripeptide--D-alanyl-D-alanine ligase